jgi:hypothetical protein
LANLVTLVLDSSVDGEKCFWLSAKKILGRKTIYSAGTDFLARKQNKNKNKNKKVRK